jgi:hypothetical protein
VPLIDKIARHCLETMKERPMLTRATTKEV